MFVYINKQNNSFNQKEICLKEDRGLQLLVTLKHQSYVRKKSFADSKGERFILEQVRFSNSR